VNITPQFIVGAVIGIALGVVGITLITEWMSARRSARACTEARTAKRPPLTRVK
jgi:hypothetical protein